MYLWVIGIGLKRTLDQACVPFRLSYQDFEAKHPQQKMKKLKILETWHQQKKFHWKSKLTIFFAIWRTKLEAFGANRLIKQHSLEITLQDTNNECMYSNSQCIEVTHTENTPKYVASHKKLCVLNTLKQQKKLET